MPDLKLTINEIGAWVEMNSELYSLMKKFEPGTTLDEKNAIFMPIKRKREHFWVLAEKYLSKGAPH